MTVLLDVECDWPFISPEVTEKELKSSSTNKKLQGKKSVVKAKLKMPNLELQ